MSLYARSAMSALRVTALLIGLLLSLNHQIDAQPPTFPIIGHLEKKVWALKELCDTITKRTGFYFVRQVDKDKIYQIIAGSDGERLDEFLDRVLPQYGLQWK